MLLKIIIKKYKKFINYKLLNQPKLANIYFMKASHRRTYIMNSSDVFPNLFHKFFKLIFLSPSR